MPEATLFDRGTLRIFHPDGPELYARVRVIERVDRVELFGQARHYPGGEPVASGVVRVATFDGATVRHVGARSWQLVIADDVYRMVPDGSCSTCGRNPLGAARL